MNKTRISLFEIIGPVMVGPSSSHTAGMARLGRMAHAVIGKVDPKKIVITLHPVIRYTYKGHRTDVALVGGILGMSEKDAGIKESLKLAEQKGIERELRFFEDQAYNPNTVLLEITMPDGGRHSIRGISVGGGSIRITQIDGVDLSPTPKSWNLLVWSRKDVSRMLGLCCNKPVKSGAAEGRFVSLVAFEREDGAILKEIGQIDGVTECRFLAPVMPPEQAGNCDKPLNSFADIIACLDNSGESMAAFALDYERNLSGIPALKIEQQMRRMLEAMKESVDRGINEPSRLIYGLTSGKDAKLLLAAEREGRTISRGIVPRAVARALAVMEVNASMGIIVAAPTAGSSGIVPGCLFAMQEEYALSDKRLVDALLVSALTGVVIAERGASLSGSVGGCQGEVGVSSAIAAAGMVSAFGGTPRQAVHAAAIALKNMLGLICDPIGGPVEVPCIKRNAAGVANAFIAADMALAGIESYIPPDEVVDALINTQKLLPQDLRGNTVGGLACTRTAKRFRESMERDRSAAEATKII